MHLKLKFNKIKLFKKVAQFYYEVKKESQGGIQKIQRKYLIVFSK